MGDLVLTILASAVVLTVVSMLLSLTWLAVEASRWVHQRREADAQEVELKIAGVKLLKASARATNEVGRKLASGEDFTSLAKQLQGMCADPECPEHGGAK